jgi:7-carboxy-7-deazaguanine synthase
MRISEIFYSVQGEGGLTGVPSVFVRTSGCNLRCDWCDTPYASWSPEGPEISLAEIVEAVSQYSARHVVITGGEPMVAKEIRELIALFQEQGTHVTVETAGTVSPDGLTVDLASLSPKLANSNPSLEKAGDAWVKRHEQTRHQPDVLRAWIESSRDYQLEFVISSEADLIEAQSVVTSIGIPILPEKILLMPEGVSMEVMRTRYPLLIQACLSHGYRLSPRLHIELFGNKRGT